MPRIDLPAGYVRRENSDATIVARADLVDALVAAGAWHPETLRGAAQATYEGRGQPFGVVVAGIGRVFIRPYLRGGLLSRLNPDRYPGEGRFLAELCALVEAAEAGVPVCSPIGYVAHGAGLGSRRGWLLLHEIPDTRDVLAFLTSDPAPAERRAVLATSGRAIRALHDAGFEHPDLHFKNLLLLVDGRVLVLDLDRLERHAELSRAHRLAGLFRFDRYAAKQVAAGASLSRTDRMRVLRAYAGEDWPERAERREIARRLAAHVARHARKTAASHARRAEGAPA